MIKKIPLFGETTVGLVQQGIYEMAAKVLKTNEVHLMNFLANTKFRFSKPPLHKYPNRYAQCSKIDCSKIFRYYNYTT